jgi:hypothetical protein
MEGGPKDCYRDTELLRLKILRRAIEGADVSAADVGYFVGCLR